MNLGFYLAEYRALGDPDAPVPGGPARTVRGLTQSLSRQGHRVTVFAQGNRDSVTSEGAVPVRVFRRPSATVPFSVAPDLLDYLRTNPDALDGVVLNGVFHPDLARLALAARRSGLPYLVSPLDPYHPAIFRRHRLRKAAYWRLIERRLLQASAGVLVMIDGHGAYLNARGITAPFVTVPTGIDHGAARTRVRPAPLGGAVRLGYLGRMDSWHKGVDLLLEGFAAVTDRFPGLRLTLTGSGPDEPRLKQMAAQLGLSGAVTFTGADHRSSVEILSDWDALITPSRFDGYPMTVLEAMVAERPVVVSTEAGISDHVERAGCGLTIPPSARGVADGISRLLARQDDWPSMAARGRAYVAKHFDWDTIARNAAHDVAGLLGIAAGPATAPNAASHEKGLLPRPPDRPAAALGAEPGFRAPCRSVRSEGAQPRW